jgi:hypothetical protein
MSTTPRTFAKVAAGAKRFGGLVLVALALAAIGLLGPWVVQQMTPARLEDAQHLIDQLWWPASALRAALYGVLAWGVYPLWVDRQRQRFLAQTATLAPAGEDALDDQYRQPLALRITPWDRAAQWSWRIFAAFLASDLLLAQGPFWLIRG